MLLSDLIFSILYLDFPGTENEDKIHGQNVVKISHLFGKLYFILKMTPSAIQSGDHHLASAIHGHANIFNIKPSRPQEAIDEDINIWTNNARKVSCKDVVFLWGFKDRISAGMLKDQLQGSHEVFTEAFDVKLVDRSCAIVVFWQPGLSETFLNVMNSKEISGPLREMVSEGMKAAGYDIYKSVVSSGFWESLLADALDKALGGPNYVSDSDSETKQSEIYWFSELMINLDEL